MRSILDLNVKSGPRSPCLWPFRHAGLLFLVNALVAGAEALTHWGLPAVNFILHVLKRQPVEGALYVSEIGFCAS